MLVGGGCAAGSPCGGWWCGWCLAGVGSGCFWLFPAHAASLVALFVPSVLLLGWWLVWGFGVGVMGLLVENCIVDASILKKKQFLR